MNISKGGSYRKISSTVELMYLGLDNFFFAVLKIALYRFLAYGQLFRGRHSNIQVDINSSFVSFRPLVPRNKMRN